MKFEKSFTLIELLIVIFILVTGVMAVLEAFPLGIRVAKSSQMGTTAAFLAQEKIEEIIAQSYDEILTGAFTEAYGFDSSFPSYKRVTNIICVNPDADFIEVENCSPDPKMKKIRVIVFWKSSFGISEKSFEVMSLFSER